MLFNEFPLGETLLANIEKMGFKEPSPIQSQVLPLALEGGDVSGLSRTGTGKTAAFLIPSIHRLNQLPADRLILCLAPTRELAQQIEQEASKLSQNMPFGTVSIVGGMSPEDQVRSLQKGARIISGTPGRVIDLYKEKALDLSRVDILVFDEADRMFDMGFVRDMQYILEKVNPKRQILLFSATMNFTVLNMIYEFGANPQEINVSRDQMTADKIDQLIYHVGDNEKASALLAVCNKHCKEGSIIVFVNYKERVPWVAELLTLNGIPAEGLSSLMRQERRNKIIQSFKQGKFRALVATDVASRGLDVDDVSLVVNYHLPEDAPTYVHRVGRTARAGRSGIAVSIPSSEDAINQVRIEELLSIKIPTDWLNEEDMPKDLKYPARDFASREDGEDSRPSRPPHRNNDRGPRTDRHERHRGPSAHGPRPEHGDRHQARGPRTDRGPGNGPRGPKEKFVAPPNLPSPLIGNPVIYCMKTGKPKNRSEMEMQSMHSAHKKLFPKQKEASTAKKSTAPALIKKISSKMTALFGAKKE